MLTSHPSLARAFAPMHKRALGVAVGLTVGVGVFLVTAFALVTHPDEASFLNLLGEYFYGYTLSWRGAFIGLWWGFVAGFAGGWFLAFCRNLTLAVWMFVVRTKASLNATSDFLDHI